MNGGTELGSNGHKDGGNSFSSNGKKGESQNEAKKKEATLHSSKKEVEIEESPPISQVGKFNDRTLIERGKSTKPVSDIPALRKSPRKRYRYRIPVPLSQLLPGLVAAQLLNPVQFKAFSMSRTSMNGEESYCEFHMGCVGHSTDNCFELHQSILELIDRGLVNFQRKDVAPFWKKSKTRHKTSDDEEKVETSDDEDKVETSDQPDTRHKTSDDEEKVETSDDEEKVETSPSEPVKHHTSQNVSEDHSSKSSRISIKGSILGIIIMTIFQFIVLIFLGIIAASLFPISMRLPSKAAD